MMARNLLFYRSKNFLVAAISIALLTTMTPAIANGGGGGGGGSISSGKRVDAAESYREGVEALKAGDYRTAEKRFEEVLSVAKDMPEANYYMGLAKVGREKDKASVRFFNRAIKERPDFIEAREQVALVYIRTERPEEAEKQLVALKDMLASCANNGCEEVVMTRTEQAIANVEAALGVNTEEDADPTEESDEMSRLPGAIDRFVRLAPLSVGDTRYIEAVKLINQEKYTEAITDLYKAQAIVGPHPDILNYLGFAHRKLNRFDEAKEYYALALKIDPEHLGVTEYLGELYLETGELAKAKRQLARLDKLCTFGCAEREDLARLIAVKQSDRLAAR